MIKKKEQDNTSGEKKNEMEISNMCDNEFKVMIVKMFTGLERGVKELRETFNRDRK